MTADKVTAADAAEEKKLFSIDNIQIYILIAVAVRAASLATLQEGAVGNEWMKFNELNIECYLSPSMTNLFG